jgi:hypothetical protein
VERSSQRHAGIESPTAEQVDGVYAQAYELSPPTTASTRFDEGVFVLCLTQDPRAPFEFRIWCIEVRL